MIVRRATPADGGSIFELMERAPRQRVHLGNEDLAAAIESGRFLLLLDDKEELVAFLVTLPEERPPTLPASAPDRVYVRGVAVRGGVSPTIALQALLAAFRESVSRARRPLRLIAYGSEAWIDRALRAAGMTLLEQVRYLTLDRLSKRQFLGSPGKAAWSIGGIAPDEFQALAILDADAFGPLWHLSDYELHELWLRGPLLAARTGSQVVGYASLLLDQEIATIARLAVAPAAQGQGIGRALLMEALRIAQQAGYESATLNTQSSNLRSQRLYRSIGFSATGQSFGVFVLDLPGAAAPSEPVRSAEGE